jgi:hypothetical protein
MSSQHHIAVHFLLDPIFASAWERGCRARQIQVTFALALALGEERRVHFVIMKSVAAAMAYSVNRAAEPFRFVGLVVNIPQGAGDYREITQPHTGYSPNPAARDFSHSL